MNQTEDSSSHLSPPHADAKEVLKALNRLEAVQSLEIQMHVLMIRQLRQTSQQQAAQMQPDVGQPDFVLTPFRSAA